MSTGQLTVAQLQERYNITRNPLYDRLKAIDRKLTRIGKKSVATESLIKELDDLDQHLKQGGTLKNYSSLGEVVYLDSTVQDSTPRDRTVQDIYNNGVSGNLAKIGYSTEQSSSSAVQDSTVQLMTAVIEAMGKQRSPLDAHRDLEEAEVKGWLLTTAEVKAIIGVKPLVKKGRDFYQRGVWKFAKVGKIGAQTAWKVTKN